MLLPRTRPGEAYPSEREESPAVACGCGLGILYPLIGLNHEEKALGRSH
jgi:hypothetical protein